MSKNHSCHLYISGMTCIQCQNKIAATLKKLDGVQKVQVSYEQQEATFVYDQNRITVPEITGTIQDLGYHASTQRPAAPLKKLLAVIGAVTVLFILLQRFGLLTLLAPSQLAESGMGYGTLFFVGLITSVHCIAMCGGINLSQSLPNTDIHSDKKKISYLSPILYNTGRVISFVAPSSSSI